MLVAYVFFISDSVVEAGPTDHLPDAPFGSVCSVAIVDAHDEKDLIGIQSLRLRDFKEGVQEFCVSLVGRVK